MDGRDLGRTYPSKLSVVGDIQFSLRELNKLLVEKVAPKKVEFEKQCEKAKQRFEQRRSELESEVNSLLDQDEIHPLVGARELSEGIGTGTPIVDEAIATASHLRKFLNNSSTRQYSFLRGGALGWGMPAAVGFSLGIGRKPVVSIVGDGAAMYSPQALWTAVHENLPVTFVVINNREYNVLKNFMRAQPHYKAAQTGKFVAMDICNPVIDFQALAKSMGMAAIKVDRAGDITQAVRRAIDSGEPNLIEIKIGTEK